MQPHSKHLKLHTPEQKLVHRQSANLGLTERFVSIFAGGILLSKGLKNPFKSTFLYGAYLTYRGFTGNCLVYEALGVDSRKPQAINVRGEFIIDKPCYEVYSYWRNLNNLPKSMKHLLDVEVIDEHLSHWKSNALGSLLPIDWNSEIVKDEPGRLIGWRSASGSVLQHVGRVEFDETPDGAGTVLKIVLSYHPPIGGVGIGLARLLNPLFESLLSKEINSFKERIEATRR